MYTYISFILSLPVCKPLHYLACYFSDHVVGTRSGCLDSNVERWECLLHTLQTVGCWVRQQRLKLTQQQPVGGDLPSVLRQSNESKVTSSLLTVSSLSDGFPDCRLGIVHCCCQPFLGGCGFIFLCADLFQLYIENH